jgi:diadenosine tetraphosphatase ApaH/serine/threonine PP2A family protein phosphatase
MSDSVKKYYEDYGDPFDKKNEYNIPTFEEKDEPKTHYDNVYSGLHEYDFDDEGDDMSKWNKSETGAMREAIGVPYFRQLPLEALAAGAAALEYGAQKYDNRNWEKGLPYQQMIDSLKRHIADFERGRDYDDAEGGSGLPHVALIMSSALILSASVIRGIGQDDRLPAVDDEAMTAKEAAKWIQQTLDDANKIMNGEIL